MSATPIPRSLAMALYGDLDISVLDEMPPGRTPVTTALRASDAREGVYGFIHEHDTALLDDALSQQVVLCSPTTLFAVLGVIRRAMDTFAFERASEEILRCLAGFGAQWRAFSEQIDKVDRHLDTLGRSIGELSGVRRRQLERHLARIDDLRTRDPAVDSADVLRPSSDPAGPDTAGLGAG